MLGLLAALAHLFWMLVQSLLDFFKQMLMLPACDAPLLACGALILDRTFLADIGPVVVQGQPLFLIGVVVDQTFTCRTDITDP